ncbi:MAG: DUF1232 domain-containing protein [Alphaproteobacteria bacterium]|nr:DUF1232 domain-containing protein [Alphaproteobacteria bacterium]
MPPLEGEILAPARVIRNERIVREGFWRKLRRTIGRIPFAEDAVAAFYCATDGTTPLHARAILLAAVAYFILPIDVIPDAIAGLGFSDDATVLATAIAIAGAHITEKHRDAARRALLIETATR